MVRLPIVLIKTSQLNATLSILDALFIIQTRPQPSGYVYSYSAQSNRKH